MKVFYATYFFEFKEPKAVDKTFDAWAQAELSPLILSSKSDYRLSHEKGELVASFSEFIAFLVFFSHASEAIQLAEKIRNDFEILCKSSPAEVKLDYVELGWLESPPDQVRWNRSGQIYTEALSDFGFASSNTPSTGTNLPVEP